MLGWETIRIVDAFAILIGEPLLPACCALPALARERSWAHSGAVRACPDPLFGGPYMQHRISWADGHPCSRSDFMEPTSAEGCRPEELGLPVAESPAALSEKIR